MHDDAVSLVMVAEDEQVISQFSLQFLNPVGNGLFFNGQGGVHEIDRAHWEAYRHGSHVIQAATLFQGTDGHECSKRGAW